MTTPDSAPRVPASDGTVRGRLAELAGIARPGGSDALPVTPEPSVPDTDKPYTGRMGGVEIGRGAVAGASDPVDSAADSDTVSSGTGRGYGKLLDKTTRATTAAEPTPAESSLPPSSTTARETSTRVTPKNPLVAAGGHGKLLELSRTGGEFPDGMVLRNRDRGENWVVEGTIKDPRTGRVLVVLQSPDGRTINKSPHELASVLAEKDGTWSRV